MTNSEIRTFIEQRFTDEWPYPLVPAAFENASFDPPDEGHWVRVSVQPLTKELNGLGECAEYTGMVGVQIYSPVRIGTSIQEELTDAVVGIYKGSHDNIAYEDAAISTPGEVEGWYQRNILIGYNTTG